VELRRQEKIAYVKIIYCGPPGAGKSTNIGWLHREAKAGRGELLTAALGRDHMLWFDFEPLQPTTFRDFQIRFLVATVPGAVVSGASRKHVLRGTDGVVFVADSASNRLYETLSAYRETAHSLDAPLEASAVPIVLQYNKRDLEKPLSRSELDEGLNTHRQPVFDAVATRGQGVLETFRGALLETLASIAPHNEGLPLLRGMAIPEYTDALVKKLFSRASFYEPAMAAAAEAPTDPVVRAAPGRIMHDIATEPVTRKLSLVDFEAALAAAQAKTASAPVAPEPPSPTAPPAPAPVAATPPPATLAAPPPAAALPPPALDAASAPPNAERYDDLRHAIEAARALAFGAPLEATLAPVLARLVSATDAFTASVLLPSAGGVSVAASHPLSGDPIASRPRAERLVATLSDGTAPRAHEPSGNPLLADALRGQGLGTVVSAPLRSPRGLHGVLLVYLTEDADPMRPSLVDHIGAVATALTLVIRPR
jgi:signal recognition particle receptor subunit beta